MGEMRVVDNDILKLHGEPTQPRDQADGEERLVATLFWGDAIRVEAGGRQRRWGFARAGDVS